MKHEVFWAPNAENELADLWTNAQDRAAITRSAFRIDQRLENDPEGESESRPFNERILFEAPLAVLFEIDGTTRRVQVLHMWSYFRRRRDT